VANPPASENKKKGSAQKYGKLGLISRGVGTFFLKIVGGGTFWIMRLEKHRGGKVQVGAIFPWQKKNMGFWVGGEIAPQVQESSAG